MSSPTAKLMTPGRLIADVILCALFFVYLYTLLRSHVPSNDPKMIMLWAGLGSACLTGVFWLAIQMFRVVYLVAQADKRK